MTKKEKKPPGIEITRAGKPVKGKKKKDKGLQAWWNGRRVTKGRGRLAGGIKKKGIQTHGGPNQGRQASGGE